MQKCTCICFYVAVMSALGVFFPVCAFAQSPIHDRLHHRRPLVNAPSARRRKKASRLDLLHWAADGYLAGGTVLDAVTTANGLDHPTMAYRTNGSFLMRYVLRENGWARCLGNRDVRGVVTANIALNLGVFLLSQRLYHRGGRWRYLAIGLLVAKATSSTLAGLHNHRLEVDVNKHVRKATGYKGAIVWHF